MGDPGQGPCRQTGARMALAVGSYVWLGRGATADMMGTGLELRGELRRDEPLAGIPGTLGGALAMNAGAWGGETRGQVEQRTGVRLVPEVRILGGGSA